MKRILVLASILVWALGACKTTAVDPLTKNLEAHFSLDGTAVDKSGRNVSASTAGTGLKATQDRSGNAGKALSFSGFDAVVVDSPVSFFYEKFSVSLWARPSAVPFRGGTGILLSLGSQGGDLNLGLSNDYFGSTGFTGTIYTSATTNVFIQQGLLPTASRWYHLVLTFDGSQLAFYVDGKLVEKKTSDKKPYYGSGNSSKFILGARDSFRQQGYQGDLDDFRIYSRALRETEIQKLFESK